VVGGPLAEGLQWCLGEGQRRCCSRRQVPVVHSAADGVTGCASVDSLLEQELDEPSRHLVPAIMVVVLWAAAEGSSSTKRLPAPLLGHSTNQGAPQEAVRAIDQVSLALSPPPSTGSSG